MKLFFLGGSRKGVASSMRDTRVKVEKGFSPFFPPHQLDSNRVVSGKERGYLKEDGREAHLTTETFSRGEVGDHEHRDVVVRRGIYDDPRL